MISPGGATFTIVLGLALSSVDSGFAPPLPTGRRTQYYYRYDDGGYKYGYDTGKGAYSKAVASASNEVQGNYAYEGPGGKVNVKYTAGKDGFLPEGNAPNNEAEPAGWGSSTANYYKPQTVEEQGPGNATYSFAYNVGDQSRQEVSDANGNIHGSYSFVSNDGVTRNVEYEAGAEKGFVVKGSHLPLPAQPMATYPGYGQAPNIHRDYSGALYTGAQNIISTVPSSYSSVAPFPGRAYEFAYNAADHSRHESSDANGNVVGSFSFIANDDKMNRKVNYASSAEKGFVAFGNHLPIPAVSTAGATSYIQSNVPSYTTQQPFLYSASPQKIESENDRSSDGSYSFSYNIGDQSRTESSDALGNVIGSFSFIAKDDGMRRQVDYEAGAEKGFIARGDHLPKVVPTSAVPATAFLVGSTQTNFPSAIYAGLTNTPSSSMADGSYSFGYNAGDHSRQEMSDSSGNVKGSYSYVAKDDGVLRKVEYEAGPIGFIASGAHLPLQPHNLAPEILISKPVDQTSITEYDETMGTTGPSDASYSFSYNAGDHSRQEASDSLGNVVGSFSFISKDDGLNRKVDYEAGADKGFIARGSHLPKTVPTAFLNTIQPPVIGQLGSHNLGGVREPIAGSYLPSSIATSVTEPYFESSGQTHVRTFLTPNAHHKVGYIYDTQ